MEKCREIQWMASSVLLISLALDWIAMRNFWHENAFLNTFSPLFLNCLPEPISVQATSSLDICWGHSASSGWMWRRCVQQHTVSDPMNTNLNSRGQPNSPGYWACQPSTQLTPYLPDICTIVLHQHQHQHNPPKIIQTEWTLATCYCAKPITHQNPLATIRLRGLGT